MGQAPMIQQLPVKELLPRYFPLLNLHVHLDGSITLDMAKKLARLQNIKLPTENDAELLKKLQVSPNCHSLNEFLDCFDLPCSLIQTKEGITEAVYLLQEDQKKQGVVYLEIRFAPQKCCDKGLTQEDAILAALEGLKKSDLHTNLILCLMRDKYENNKTQNRETIELAKKYLVKDNGVVAIDLAGAEALFPTKNYEEDFKIAKEYGIPFTIHAGEADGPSSMKDAIRFGAKRIGHGIRAFEDPELIDKLIEDNIILEMAPTSNIQTEAIKNFDDYPLVYYLKHGVKCTINTDDLAICGTNIRNEFEMVINKFHLTTGDVKLLIRNSIEAAFTDGKTKKELYAKL